MNDLGELKARLGMKVRVLLSDGRVIEGEFQCMDKDLNCIIGSAMEYHGMSNLMASSEETSDIPSRFLGLAMVPGNHLLKIFCLQQQSE